MDYGAFSHPCKEKYDLYREHMIRRQRSVPTSRYLPPRPPPPPHFIKANLTDDDVVDKFSHVKKRVVGNHKTKKTLEKKLSVYDQSKSLSRRQLKKRRDDNSLIACVGTPRDSHKVQQKISPESFACVVHLQKKVTPCFQRSKSDVTKRVVFDESRNTIRRIERDNYELSDYDSEGSNNTDDDKDIDLYASLSTDELNLRVEDFIQRFNSQIRLQQND